MFEKSKLNKEIKDYIAQIEELEKKRYRSQAALMTAFMNKTVPDDRDVDYFNEYTMQIEELRGKMHEAKARLESLKK